MVDVLIVGGRTGRRGRRHPSRARRRARAAGRSRALSARQAVRRHAQPRHAGACCGGSGCARAIEARGLPLDGMLVTGARRRVRGRYGRRPVRTRADSPRSRSAPARGGDRRRRRVRRTATAVAAPIVETADGRRRSAARSSPSTARASRMRVPAHGDDRRRRAAIDAGLRARTRPPSAAAPPLGGRRLLRGRRRPVIARRDARRAGRLHRRRPDRGRPRQRLPRQARRRRRAFGDPARCSRRSSPPIRCCAIGSRARAGRAGAVAGTAGRRGRRRAGVPGLLLAGDAAGFVDPMTGDGLRFAVRGAELAADAALAALERSRGSTRRRSSPRRGHTPSAPSSRSIAPAADGGLDAPRQRRRRRGADRAGPAPRDDSLRWRRRRVAPAARSLMPCLRMQPVALLLVVVVPWLLLETWQSARQARALRAAGAVEAPDDVYRAMPSSIPGMFLAMTAEGLLAPPACTTLVAIGIARLPRRQAAQVVGHPLARPLLELPCAGGARRAAGHERSVSAAAAPQLRRPDGRDRRRGADDARAVDRRRSRRSPSARCCRAASASRSACSGRRDRRVRDQAGDATAGSDRGAASAAPPLVWWAQAVDAVATLPSCCCSPSSCSEDFDCASAICGSRRGGLASADRRRARRRVRHWLAPRPSWQERLANGVLRAWASDSRRVVFPPFVASRTMVLFVGFMAVVLIGYAPNAPPFRVAQRAGEPAGKLPGRRVVSAARAGWLRLPPR